MAVPDYSNPLDFLYQIVNDLWPADGTTPSAAKPNAAAQPGAAAQPAGGQQQPAAVAETPKAAEAPEAPPFEEFWRRADERVDWTEALLYEKPRTAVPFPRLWAAFHEFAPRVLKGDLGAYSEVLRLANPLSDLKPYAERFTVTAPDADSAEVSFDALPCGVEDKRLLSGLALRCARDVLALLPVRSVTVHGRLPGGVSLDVTYPYQSLRKAQFGFIDPVAYAEEMGCAFRTSEEEQPDEEA